MDKLNMYFTILLNVFLLAHYSYAVDSVTARDYCLAPINISNCGQSPTPMYSYYKPGSICIITIWKGCPTKNMFYHIDHCTSLCEGSPTGERNRCDIPLDTNHCTNHGTPVFTYSAEKQTCVEATWYGCSPLNKFNDKQSCVDTCHNPNSHLEWTEKIKSLDIYFIKGLYTVLEELTKTNEKTNKKPNVNIKKNAAAGEINKGFTKNFKRTSRTIKYVTQSEDENLLTDKDGDVMKVMNNNMVD